MMPEPRRGQTVIWLMLAATAALVLVGGGWLLYDSRVQTAQRQERLHQLEAEYQAYVQANEAMLAEMRKHLAVLRQRATELDEPDPAMRAMLDQLEQDIAEHKAIYETDKAAKRAAIDELGAALE